MYLPALTDRAKLAINCLTELCDKSRGCIPYFYTRLSDTPLSPGWAIWSYGDGLGRAVDALGLLRHMLGESVHQEPDSIMAGTLINLLGADGLSWCPAEPWTMNVYHTRPAWLQQGTLLALTTRYQLTGDAHYRELAERNIDAICRMTTFHPEGYGDYPGDYYTIHEGWKSEPHDPMHVPSVFATSTTMPLMRYYAITGYEPALKLASALIAWAIRDHENGATLFDKGHFHCQSRLMTAILQQGIYAGKKEYLQIGENLYAKAKQLGTLAGWFPEQINNPSLGRSELSETCCLTDMIESAILLAIHRDEKYWHDVERYAKNYLLVHQIVDTDWFDELTSTSTNENSSGRDNISPDPFRQAMIGGFAGWGSVTAMSDDTHQSNLNQYCCNAAGARALYDAWRYAITEENGVFSVNLFIHRSHAVMDMIAEEGATGRLEINMKQACKLRVRIPEFVQADEIVIVCNGKTRTCHSSKQYVEIGDVQAVDRIEISYPQKERTTVEKIYPGEFTYFWQGSTVIKAEPLRGVRPLFTADRFTNTKPVISNTSVTEIPSI